MLRVENLRRFQLSLEAERARLEKRVTKSYRDFVGRAFQDLLMHTPQYSGQMTASWHILLTNEGAPAHVGWYKKGQTGRFYGGTFEPGEMGDGEAVMAAWDREAPKLDKIRWNTNVSFANTDPMASAVQANALTPPVRPVNLVDGAVAMAAYVRHKYTGNITLAQLT